MKRWNKVIASLLAGAILFTGCQGSNPEKEYSAEELDRAKQTIAYNLGDLNADISQEEKEEKLLTVAEIQDWVQKREQENTIEPNARESYLRKEFDTWVTEQTAQFYEVDDSEIEDPPPVEDNNHDRIYEYLKGQMNPNELALLQRKVDRYIEAGDQEAYDFAKEKLQEIKSVNGNLLLFLLVQYPTMKTEKVYRVKDAKIEEEAFLKEQIEEAKKGWFSFLQKEEKKTEIAKEVSKETEDTILTAIPKVIKKENLEKFDYIILCTDGESNGLASVIESPDGDGSGTRWLMQIDSNDLDDDFYGTLVHEYGHYLTLNQTQADYTEEYNVKNYCEIGMVTKENSLMNQFYQTFWKDYILEEFPTKNSFYLRNQNSFVSDYAATDPTEDIAETFRVFVMEDKPKGDTIRDKKVRFLYDWPGYVELRKEIRRNLKLD